MRVRIPPLPPSKTFYVTDDNALLTIRYRRAFFLLELIGLLSMVQVMHGVEGVMMAFMDTPEIVCQMLDAAVEILIASANAQFEAGADALAVGEGGAGANMISPGMHREYLLSVHQRMAKEINGPLIMHICGDVTPKFDVILDSGFACFNFDRAIDPKKIVEASRGRMTVMGNVGTGELLNGPIEEINRQVTECLEAGVDIISPGCAVSPECPNANIKAISESITRWYK